MHHLRLHQPIPPADPPHDSVVPQRPDRPREPHHPVLVPPPGRDPRPRPPHRPHLTAPTKTTPQPKTSTHHPTRPHGGSRRPVFASPTQWERREHRPPGRSAAERAARVETTSHLKNTPERVKPHLFDPTPRPPPLQSSSRSIASPPPSAGETKDGQRHPSTLGSVPYSRARYRKLAISARLTSWLGQNRVLAGGLHPFVTPAVPSRSMSFSKIDPSSSVKRSPSPGSV